jgi:hypothetical protein
MSGSLGSQSVWMTCRRGVIGHMEPARNTNESAPRDVIVYPDADGDGSGTLPLQILCEGSAVPAGYPRYGDDEDDTNASIGPLPPEDLLPLFY